MKMQLLYVIIFYVILFIVIAFIQCIILELVKYLRKLLRRYNRIILVMTSLIVLFIDFYLCCLLIAASIWYHKVLPDFHSCLIYSVDSFSTLGANEPLGRPWTLLSPMIAIIGIVCIAFVTTGAYNIIQEDQDISIFG